MPTRPFRRLWRALLALALAVSATALAQSNDKPFTPQQLDQMTAQIALFPDALLSQVLMAATYPSDVAAAAAWSRANPDQKGDDAVMRVANEPWDPSVQSLVAFPQVAIMMGEKPDWVRDLGDAFLAQPDDVMDSVQRLRTAAQKAGNLNSNEQVVVTTQQAPPPTVIVQTAAPPPPQVIVIEQRSPDVIFVPVYNPTYVFGPWMWPAYPPIFIPPPPGFWFSTAVATGIAWGIGIGVRNAMWGNVNWWGRDVTINVNRWNNINVNNRITNVNNNVRWNHNVNNRRDVPYRGNVSRDDLRRRADAANREQYRGRDADRQRAQQTLQNRGVTTDRAALQNVDRSQLQNRAQNVDRSQVQNRAQNVDRSQLQNRAQNVDRSQVQNRAQSVDRSQVQNRAQSVDRSQVQNRAQNPAFQGVSDRQARSEINRGNANRQAVQQSQRPQANRPSGGGGGGSARPQVQRGQR